MSGELKLPADLRSMLEAARRVGRPRLVGGGVRDWLLELAPKDFDVEVAGVDFETLQRTLAPFGATDVVGRSFGVIKSAAKPPTRNTILPPAPRIETGAGHRGFAVAPDPALSDADAAARRDFTVNAIALDPFTHALIDPHGGSATSRPGVAAYERGVREDPLRVLRAMQLAALRFLLAPETAALCRSITGTFSELPSNACGTSGPSGRRNPRSPRAARRARRDGLAETFPRSRRAARHAARAECIPKATSSRTRSCASTRLSCSSTGKIRGAAPRMLMFAVLAHDFGKPATTERAEKRGLMRWISPGHEAAADHSRKTFSAASARRSMSTRPCACSSSTTSRTITGRRILRHERARLARKLAPATIDDLAAVMRADSNGRLPHLARHARARRRTHREGHALALVDAAPKRSCSAGTSCNSDGSRCGFQKNSRRCVRSAARRRVRR